MTEDKGSRTEEFSPEITETGSKSFRNPIKAFKERRASKASAAETKAALSQPTETDAGDRTPLMPQEESQVSATDSHEQDSYISMMRATRNMSPEEVTAYLAQKAQADQEKHKNDTTWSGKNFSSY